MAIEPKKTQQSDVASGSHFTSQGQFVSVKAPRWKQSYDAIPDGSFISLVCGEFHTFWLS